MDEARAVTTVGLREGHREDSQGLPRLHGRARLREQGEGERGRGVQQVTCFELMVVMLPRHHREGSTVQRGTGGPCPTLSRAQTLRDRSRPSPCRLCPRHRLLHLCKSTPVHDDSRAYHMAAAFPDSCSGGSRNQSTHMITLASPGRINATLGGLGATDGAMLGRTAAPRPTPLVAYLVPGGKARGCLHGSLNESHG